MVPEVFMSLAGVRGVADDFSKKGTTVGMSELSPPRAPSCCLAELQIIPPLFFPYFFFVCVPLATPTAVVRAFPPLLLCTHVLQMLQRCFDASLLHQLSSSQQVGGPCGHDKFVLVRWVDAPQDRLNS